MRFIVDDVWRIHSFTLIITISLSILLRLLLLLLLPRCSFVFRCSIDIYSCTFSSLRCITVQSDGKHFIIFIFFSLLLVLLAFCGGCCCFCYCRLAVITCYASCFRFACTSEIVHDLSPIGMHWQVNVGHLKTQWDQCNGQGESHSLH